MASDAEMCAAVFTWLTGTTVTTQAIDGTPLRWPLYWRVRGIGCFVPIPDYANDEAASAALLDTLEAERGDSEWPVWSIRIIRELDWWEVELHTWNTEKRPYTHARQHDPDRKRAILCAAYEASKP